MPEHVIIKEDIDIFLQSVDKVEACASLDLDNVDNTADLDKPVSSASQAQLDLKVDISSFTDRVNDYLSPQTLVSGSTVSYDCSNGVNAILTLTSDCLLENITNASAGSNGTLSIVQDSVGGHLLTLDSNYTIMNGDTVYTSSMLPNRIGKISWDTHDGVNFFLWVTT